MGSLSRYAQDSLSVQLRSLFLESNGKVALDMTHLWQNWKKKTQETICYHFYDTKLLNKQCFMRSFHHWLNGMHNPSHSEALLWIIFLLRPVLTANKPERFARKNQELLTDLTWNCLGGSNWCNKIAETNKMQMQENNYTLKFGQMIHFEKLENLYLQTSDSFQKVTSGSNKKL